MGCCRVLAKIVLITFNVIFFLSGLGLVGLGVYVMLTPQVAEIDKLFVEAGISTALIHGLSYGIIAVGAVCTIAGFTGCCGAVKESRCLLGTYIFVLVVLLAGQIAVAVLSQVKGTELTAIVKTQLEKVQLDSANMGKTEQVMATVQQEFQCCGLVKGCLDWTGGVTANCTCSATASPTCNKAPYTPKGSTTQQCTVSDSATKNIYTQSCFVAIEAFIKNNLFIILIVASAVAATEILGICFGCIVCCNINEYEAA